jgi:outer membrane protein insertion porin family
MTPPRSVFTDVPFDQASAEDRYKWIEYHKWRFDGAWYTSLTGKFVLATQMQLGFLGGYSKNVEQPFGRYFVGGSGLTGFNLDDRELIRLRGYADNSIGPRLGINPIGGKMFQKFTAEVRYPVSLNPQASVYVLGFLEAGNNFANIRSFQPFNNMKSAGAGIRVFLPMFGLLGVDWGYGFDNNPNFNITKRGNLHISIGQTF